MKLDAVYDFPDNRVSERQYQLLDDGARRRMNDPANKVTTLKHRSLQI
jgi:hypothetical protein